MNSIFKIFILGGKLKKKMHFLTLVSYNTRGDCVYATTVNQNPTVTSFITSAGLKEPGEES